VRFRKRRRSDVSLKIKGFIKTSLIDYPGKISSVIFLGGCNFRCGFCFNPVLVKSPDSLDDVPEELVFEFLRKRKKWIDGVVLLGGEPTLHEDIIDFSEKLKKMGFLVKLDTNGSNPEVVEKMIKLGLVDYIAMDVKTSFERYDILGLGKFVENVRKTAELIRRSGLDYEFRTTVIPGIVEESDILEIGKSLKGSKRYFIQQFRPEPVLDEKFQQNRTLSEGSAGKVQENSRTLLRVRRNKRLSFIN